MERPNGKYCRLVDLQSSAEGIKEESFRLSINKAMESIDLKDDGADDADDADGTTVKNNETSNDDDDGSGSFSMMRVWKLATPDIKYLITGSIGAVITGRSSQCGMYYWLLLWKYFIHLLSQFLFVFCFSNDFFFDLFNHTCARLDSTRLD